MSKATKNIYEFSRPIGFDEISDKLPFVKKITASEAECEALAKRFKILGIKDVEAEVRLKKQGGGTIVKATATFKARATQECIVTLEPVEEAISGSAESYYTNVPPAVPLASELEMPSAREAPEFVENGQLDMGEFVAQYVALDLNLYPRAEGAEFDDSEAIAQQGKHNPFAQLKVLKDENEK